MLIIKASTFYNSLYEQKLVGWGGGGGAGGGALLSPLFGL